MTEPTTDPGLAGTTPAATDEAAVTGPRRGRPRPETTIARDEQVLASFDAEGKTREEIISATGLTASQVYLSLWRLRNNGLIERVRNGGKHVWRHVTPAS